APYLGGLLVGLALVGLLRATFLRGHGLKSPNSLNCGRGAAGVPSTCPPRSLSAYRSKLPDYFPLSFDVADEAQEQGRARAEASHGAVLLEGEVAARGRAVPAEADFAVYVRGGQIG